MALWVIMRVLGCCDSYHGDYLAEWSLMELGGVTENARGLHRERYNYSPDPEKMPYLLL